MKKITLVSLFLLMICGMMAQAPERFTYQAVVRNATNQLIINTNVGVRVSVLQGTATGNPVYVETHTVTTNANGLLTVQVGDGNATQGSLATVDWGDGPYFLKSEIDPNGGSNYTITSVQQMLSVPYALYASEAGNGFSGDYNDLTNTPTIPTVPTNVSAFTNDAGYLTTYTETDPTVPAWAKEANKPTYNYSEIANTPTIPIVPTNVSAFSNDAGYLTSYTETDPTVPAWAKEANKPSYNYSEIANTPTIPTVPTNVSAFNNDAGYITMDSIPTIPTVPSNVSAFTNDVGYITSYTETDPNVPAWAKEVTKPAYDYSEITNTPVIPTVPTNVSAFENDVPYLTSFTEQQVLSISNDTIFLTGGSFVKLPEGFSGNYNDLTNKPEIPTTPTNVSEFANDAGYITMDSVPTIPVEVSAFNNDAQYVSNAECADVNLCALANALSQLQALVEEQQSRIEELESLIGTADTTTTPIDTTTVTPTDTTTVTDGIPCPDAATVTDIDGNVYNTVQIGNQCWMKENLRTTRYADGTLIPVGGSNTSSTEPYYYDFSSSEIPLEQRGYLYNWPAAIGPSSVSANNQGICPTGWHVPSNGEWQTLTQYVGNQSNYLCGNNSAYIAKALASTTGWDSNTITCAVGNTPNSNNATGFCALPAGCHNSSGFYDSGVSANFWGSTEYGSGASYRFLESDGFGVGAYPSYKYYGFSVRCLRDENGGGGTTQTQPTITTGEATNITSVSATLSGTVSNPDNVDITAQGFEWKATTGGTYAQVNATGETMTYSLTGLTANTGYTYRAFVTTASGTSYGNEISFSTLFADGIVVVDEKSCPAAPMVTDHEGNVYATVKIGNQCWMRDNLRTTTSPSTGTYLIPTTGTDDSFTGKQARWYNNDSATYAPMNYGLLYNWNAAMDTFNTAYGETSVNTDINNALSVSFTGHRRGICPAGWHLPSDAEWNTMEATISGSDWQTSYETSMDWRGSHAGKLAGDGWINSSTDGAPGNSADSNHNASYFSAVPAGLSAESSFSSVGSYASFWSSSQYTSGSAWFRDLRYDTSSTFRYWSEEEAGSSVRCLRDETTVTTSSTTNITSTSATLNGTVFNPDNVDITAQGFEWKAADGGTYALVNATGETMSYNLAGLTSNTGYTYRAFVTTAEGSVYGDEVYFTTLTSGAVVDAKSCPDIPTVTDHEGNVYATVLIGSQCWMRDNLRTTTSPSTGTYLVITDAVTGYTYTGKQARWFNNNSATYAPMNYGLLYNWNAAVDTFNVAYGETSVHNKNNVVSVSFMGHRRGICPEGWHLPSNEEWNTMEETVSGSDWQTSYETSGGFRGSHAGKLAGNGWTSSSTAGAPGNSSDSNHNDSGFSVVPAGYCSGGPSYSHAGDATSFWSSSQSNSFHVRVRYLDYRNAGVRLENQSKIAGLSVRCLRD